MTDFEQRYVTARKAVIARDLARLNPMQRQGAMTTEGPLLLLAGAGSGKTTVLIQRVYNLLTYGRGSDSDEVPDWATEEDLDFLEHFPDRPDGDEVRRVHRLCAVDAPRPWEIIAITFTNKAAGELKERLAARLGPAANDVWASTFHSACVRILRRDIDRIGFEKDFTIYDTDDAKRVIKDILKEQNLDEKTFPIRSVLSAISASKDRYEGPEVFRKKAEAANDWKNTRIAKIYAAYQQKLSTANALDFDDIIYHTVTLLQKEPEVLDYYQKKFRYVLVDEYQDTNHLQYLLTGLLAGAYPAWHITSFSPALVLKGSFGLSPSGKRMRSLLVSFQYVISFALIIAALFIYLQNHYMLASSLGFDKEHVAIVELNGQLIKNIEAVENRLEQEVSVQEVSFAEDLLSASDEYTDFGRGYRENNVQFKVFVVSPDFLRLMNIPVISGRDFLQEDSKSVGGVYLFNEAARLQYDLVAGEYITGNEWYEAPPALIAGFIDDIKYASFRTEVAPMAFYVSPAAGYRPRYAYIKIKAGADIRDAVASIRKALTSIDKNFPAEIRFYDTILNNLYKRELSIGWLISLFSLIAVFISVVGVLGLVIFESEYRKKEIGLRKVHGATTSQILLMFNKVYVRILIVCFVLAIPVAYYGVNRWMVYFAYKIPMYWWVYAVAFVVVSVITFLTVTFQNWKTANENPVESIKTE